MAGITQRRKAPNRTKPYCACKMKP
jgi:hypothetical protein